MCNKGRRGEQEDEQSCREGKGMNKECDLYHQSLTLLHTVMKQKHFHLPANSHESHHGCFYFDNQEEIYNLLNQNDVQSHTYLRQWLLNCTGSRKLGEGVTVPSGARWVASA